MAKGWETTEILDWDCDIYIPASLNEPRFGLLYLHDEDGQNLLRGHEQLIEEHQLTVLAPACGACWWMDKRVPSFHPQLTPQEYLIDHVVRHAKTVLGIETSRLGLLGDGMGGQGALKLSYAMPKEFPVVAAVRPAVDFHQLLHEYHPVLSEVFDDVEAARQYTPILHVHPLNWPRFEFFCCDPDDAWFDSADRLQMKLGSIGIAFESDLQTSTQGDTQAYLQQAIPRAISYVAQKLDEHRRSLI